jgi:hypothetical protein
MDSELGSPGDKKGTLGRPDDSQETILIKIIIIIITPAETYKVYQSVNRRHLEEDVKVEVNLISNILHFP